MAAQNVRPEPPLPAGTSRGSSLPGGRRRPWARRLAGLTLGAAGLIWLLPVLVARTPIRGWVAGYLAGDLRGTVRIGSASLGWFSPVRFDDVTILDPSGQPVVTVARVETVRTLAALAWDPLTVGELRVTRPELTVACHGQETNVEQVLSGWLTKPAEDPPPAGQRVRMTLSVIDAVIRVRDDDNGRGWASDPITLSLNLGEGPVGPKVGLHVSTADGSRAGRIDTDLDLAPGGAPNDRPGIPGQGRATAHVHGFPVAVLEPFVRRVQPGIHLDGQVDAEFECRWGDVAADGLGVRVDARVVGRGLRADGPWLGADCVKLEEVEARCKAGVRGRQIEVEQADLRCDVGTVSATGRADPAWAVGDWLRQPNQKLSVTLDLARVAALLPTTLQLRKDTRVTGGRLTVTASSTARAGGVAWQGYVQTADLRGVNQGQLVDWAEPVVFTVSAFQAPAGPPVVEQFRCDAGFVRVSAAGGGERLMANASCDLGRLTRQLARFVDLGGLQAAGGVTGSLLLQQTPRGEFTLHAETQVQRLAVSGLIGRSVREDSLTARVDASGVRPVTGPGRIDAATARVDVGRESAEVSLDEPAREPFDGSKERLRVTVRGDVAAWHQRLAPWVPGLAEWQTAGTLDATATFPVGPLRGGTIDLSEATVTVRQPRIRGCGLALVEPSLTCVTGGRLTPLAGVAELRDVRVTCPTLSAHMPRLHAGLSATGSVALTGGGTLSADLGRLQRWFLDPPPNLPDPFAGTADGTFDLAPAGPRIGVGVDLTVKNFLYGQPAAPAWREPVMRVTGRGEYDLAGDLFRIERAVVSEPALTCEASGLVTDLSRRRAVAVGGTLTYDLEKLTPALRDYLGPTLALSGRETRPFRVEGPLNPPAAQLVGGRSVLSALTAEAGINWRTASLMGLQVGPAGVQARLSNGAVSFRPIESTFYDGRLRVEPTIRLEPGTAEVSLPKGEILTRARLTPQVCAGGIGYAIPVLARVVEADGSFSVRVDNGRLPLLAPGAGEMSGALVIHSARVGANPLLKQLAVLLRAPGEATLARETVVPIRLANGRVYHSNLAIVFPDLTITLEGSVGLDGSLATVASFPIPPKWVGTGKLAEAFASQVIRIPIAGTLSEPRLDEKALREANARVIAHLGTDVVKDAVKEKVKGEVEKQLKKLWKGK